MAVKEMLREEKEYQLLAGVNLDHAIGSPDTVVQSEAPTDMETKSEADLEGGSRAHNLQ
jgi:hypothetical protein